MYLLLESKQKNPLFRSPIQNTEHPRCGDGNWRMGTSSSRPLPQRYLSLLPSISTSFANAFDLAHVQGIDLYPPPDNFVPPNCTFTIDDALKTWLFKSKFDLVHIRFVPMISVSEQKTNSSKRSLRLLYPRAMASPLQASLQQPSSRRLDRTSLNGHSLDH